MRALNHALTCTCTWACSTQGFGMNELVRICIYINHACFNVSYMNLCSTDKH